MRPQIFPVQNTSSLGVDDFSLLIHDIVILQDIFTGSEVSALYFLLRIFDGLRQHLGFDSLVSRRRQLLHHNLNPLPAEKTDEIVVQSHEKSG